MDVTVAQKPAPVVPLLSTISRRFDVPDLDRHGMWLLPRFKQAYSHLNDRGVLSWIRGIVFVSDYLFICQEHAVALAQVISAHSLSPKPIIEERFVWVQDKDNKEQVAAAAYFYEDFARWAKHQGAETLVVEEMSDVPHEMVKEKLGRIFTRQVQFARV